MLLSSRQSTSNIHPFYQKQQQMWGDVESAWKSWWGSGDSKKQTKQLEWERFQMSKAQNSEINTLSRQVEVEKAMRDSARSKGLTKIEAIHIRKQLALEDRTSGIAVNHEKHLAEMDDMLQHFQERQATGVIARASELVQATDDAHDDDKETIAEVQIRRDEDAEEQYTREKERHHTLLRTAPVPGRIKHGARNSEVDRIMYESRKAERMRVEAENKAKEQMRQQQRQAA